MSALEDWVLLNYSLLQDEHSEQFHTFAPQYLVYKCLVFSVMYFIEMFFVTEVIPEGSTASSATAGSAGSDGIPDPGSRPVGVPWSHPRPSLGSWPRPHSLAT